MAPVEFFNLLSPEIHLSETQVKEINGLISTFPYFSAAQLLKSKHEIRAHQENANEIFERYSIFAHDPVMYRLWVNDDKIVENDFINAPPKTTFMSLSWRGRGEEKSQFLEVPIHKTKPEYSNESFQQTILLDAIPAENPLFELIINTVESIDSSRYGRVWIPQQVGTILPKEIETRDFIPSQIVEIPYSDSPTTQCELIDKFIREEPAITPVKNIQNDFSDTEKRALKSSEFHEEDFLSETLAKIHHRQGNLRRAKNIYEKLQLKFPEKFTYFAGLLEDLRTS